MKNYIPMDFYDSGKSTVYTTRKACEEAEGSAIEFDPSKTNLSVCIVTQGSLQECPNKSQAFKDGKDVQERFLKRLKGYKQIDSLLLEAIAEKEEGRPEKMQQYLSLRQSVRDSNPL